MADHTYYEILGVSPSAGYLDIKRAYRKLAKTHHPDKLADPTPEHHQQFARITQAYSVLSDLNKRRAYDRTLAATAGEDKSFPFAPPHYSGYPYFQYDFITPFIHSFFVPAGPRRRTKKNSIRSLLLNYRTLAVSLLGALYFFKFFSALDGSVMEKTIETGIFRNVSYYLVLKTAAGKEKKKRVKPALYERLKPGDRIRKGFFSFTYEVNGQPVRQVTLWRFILQAGMIYVFISGGLCLLEFGRR